MARRSSTTPWALTLALLCIGALTGRFATSWVNGGSVTPGAATQQEAAAARRTQGAASGEGDRVLLRGGSPSGSSAFGLRLRWLPSCLAAAAAAVALLVGAPGPARADGVDEIEIYFGAGGFQRLQHEFVLKEALDFDRRETDISTVTGYAGSKKTGELERVCFNNNFGQPGYADLGHAQVVRIDLPEDRVAEYTKFFVDNIPNRKEFEKGPRFRSVIGLRKGMKSKLIPQMREAVAGRATLVEGAGADPDTTGTDTIYVYDSRKFPFRPAEVWNQFRDDGAVRYDADYRGVVKALETAGKISNTGCS